MTQLSSVQFTECLQNPYHMPDIMLRCWEIKPNEAWALPQYITHYKGFIVLQFINQESHSVRICFASLQFEFPLCQNYLSQASPSREIKHSLFVMDSEFNKHAQSVHLKSSNAIPGFTVPRVWSHGAAHACLRARQQNGSRKEA